VEERFDQMQAVSAAAAALVLSASVALGQTMPTLPTSPTFPTVPINPTRPNSLCIPTEFEPCSSANQPAGSSVNTPPNSQVYVHAFTVDQAKSRIEAAGYSGVTELQLDVHGNWHGKALKDGRPVQVTLDFNGNVTR
jgi:hypothetical protein